MVQSGLVSGNTATHFKNGTQIGQFTHAYDTVIGKLVIGAEIGNAGFAGMDVAALLIYDRALSASERADVEAYLQRKYLVVPVVAPVLQLELLHNETEDMRIGFVSVYGLDYTLQVSTNLIQWDPLGTISGDGLPVEMIHTGGGTGPRRYYKVVVTKTGE